jgi:hypothetical protein
MNGDGFLDIIKQTSLNAPLYVGVAYNDPDSEGFFDTYEVVNNQAPYFISVGDLNNDNQLDIVITDDGADRYLLNQGNDLDGMADFVSFTYSFDEAGDDGFGGNNLIADLNNDGWNDVLIADVDVDIGGCGRRMHVYRNLGGMPGGNVTLQEQTSGTGCDTASGNPPSCIVAGVPSDRLEGVHDVAVFDIDGDGWRDMVVGRCGSTEVYMNQPPTGLAFAYPQGLPFFVDAGQPFAFQVQVSEIGGTQHLSGSGKLLVSINGSGFAEIAMTDLGSGLYEATLPAAPACTDELRFYVTADAVGGGTFLDPQSAPAETYQAVAAAGTEVVFEDGFERGVSGWSVINDASLLAGQWEAVVPVGSATGGGEQAAPDEDGEGAIDKVMAFVTQNGAVGGNAGDADVDGADYLQFEACFTGPGVFYTADDTCAVSDVDQDGDVDDDDFDVFLAAAEGDAGEVPGGVPGSQLTVNPDGAGNLVLDWGASCLASDLDYEVYEGTLGDFASHDKFLCGTGGTTTATFAAPAGSMYYLVVPSNGFREGSYGVDGSGAPRLAGVTTCLPQSVGTCQ